MRELAAFVLPLLLACCNSAAPIPKLFLDRPLKERLSPGQKHHYEVMLGRGDFLELEVLQKGIDLTVSLIDPHQGEILKADSPNHRYGPETVFFISPQAASYQVQVHAPDGHDLPGEYRIELKALRLPTSRDRSCAEALNLMIEAERRELNQEYQAAIERFRDALSIWRTVVEPAQETLTLMRIARVHRSLMQPGQALAGYQEARRLAESLGDSNLEVEILLSTGRVHEGRAAAEEAEAYEQALDISNRSGLRASAAAAHHNLAVYYHEYANFEEALNHYRAEDRLWRELGHVYNQAETERNIGDLYIRLGQPQTALDHFRRAVGLAEQTGDQKLMSDCLGWITWVYIQQENLEMAFEYNSEALRLDPTADVLQSRGSIHEMEAQRFRRLKFEKDEEEAYRRLRQLPKGSRNRRKKRRCPRPSQSAFQTRPRAQLFGRGSAGSAVHRSRSSSL